MKTLKSMVAGIALLLACITANAAVKSHATQPTQKDVVNIYIGAITNGKTENLDKVLGDDLQFNMQRGQRVNTLTKEQLLDYLKNNAVAGGAVDTTTTVLTDDENTSKIKIDFKYDGYTRTDVVTLDKSFGWKITSVNSTFK